MFADLLAQPGVREVVELRSTFGFLAFHGGSLERGTAEVAGEAAGRAGASLYAVLQPDDLRWHVPSAVIGAGASPGLARFLAHVDRVVSVHGYGRDGHFTTLLAGGADRAFAAEVGSALQRALPGYDVVSDVRAIPAELRGLHPDNPVNRTRRGGVQLELPPRVRGLGPRADLPARDALIAALATIACDANDRERQAPRVAWRLGTGRAQ